jgi:hypothetical protein
MNPAMERPALAQSKGGDTCDPSSEVERIQLMAQAVGRWVQEQVPKGSQRNATTQTLSGTRVAIDFIELFYRTRDAAVVVEFSIFASSFF